MNQISSYLTGFIALFVLLNLLLALVPGENYKRYIRFFAELLLIFTLMSPVLSLVCNSDQFLNLIQYEEFLDGLDEAARAAEKIEYLQNDYYVQEYEDTIKNQTIAIAKDSGYQVVDADVSLSETYEIQQISLKVADQSRQEQIIVGKISMEQDAVDERFQGLQQEIAAYYQIEPQTVWIGN